MNERLFEIHAKRVRLIERAARERGDFASAVQFLSRPLGFVDHCIGAARFVVARPPLVAGIALALVLLRPRRAFRWARRAFGIWQSYRWLTKKATA